MRARTFEWKAPVEIGPSQDPPDELLLDCALSIYREVVDRDYRLAHRPDRDQRKKRAVDGIFASPASPAVAIEITELLTFEGQSKIRNLFAKHLRAAERQLGSDLPRGFWCELPTDPFVHGDDWSTLGDRLVSLIAGVADSLLQGESRHRIDDIPFEIVVCRDPAWPLPFQFVRAEPSPDRIRAELRAHMTEALRHKREELQELRDTGHRTALMITSADLNFYRITWDLAYRIFLEAECEVGSAHVDDVLFAFTGDYGTAYCMAFKGEPILLDRLNTSMMRFGPQYAHLWTD